MSLNFTNIVSAFSVSNVIPAKDLNTLIHGWHYTSVIDEHLNLARGEVADANTIINKSSLDRSVVPPLGDDMNAPFCLSLPL